jgi:hypothetical protein
LMDSPVNVTQQRAVVQKIPTGDQSYSCRKIPRF